MEPNYPSYTIEELYSARDNIDRGSFPDRYQQILEHIENRRNDGDMSAEELLFLEHRKGFDSRDGCSLLIRTGATAASLFVARVIALIGGEIQNNPVLGSAIVISLLGLASFTFKKSRVAFSILVLTFISMSVPQILVFPTFTGVLFNYVLGVFMIAGAVGSFVWEQKYKDSDKEVS